MTIELTQIEIKMLEDRRRDLDDGLVNIIETKALLNRIYEKLGKQPRKRKAPIDYVAMFQRNRKRN